MLFAPESRLLAWFYRFTKACCLILSARDGALVFRSNIDDGWCDGAMVRVEVRCRSTMEGESRGAGKGGSEWGGEAAVEWCARLLDCSTPRSALTSLDSWLTHDARMTHRSLEQLSDQPLITCTTTPLCHTLLSLLRDPLLLLACATALLATTKQRTTHKKKISRKLKNHDSFI